MTSATEIIARLETYAALQRERPNEPMAIPDLAAEAATVLRAYGQDLTTARTAIDLRPIRQAIFDAIMDHYGYDEADMDDQSDASELVDRIMNRLASVVSPPASGG